MFIRFRVEDLLSAVPFLQRSRCSLKITLSFNILKKPTEGLGFRVPAKPTLLVDDSIQIEDRQRRQPRIERVGPVGIR